MQRPTAQLPAPDLGTASHDQVSTTSTGGRGSIFTPHRRSPTGEIQDLGITEAITGNRAAAEEYLTEAVATDRPQVSGWLNELAVVGAQHPQVLGLIPL